MNKNKHQAIFDNISDYYSEKILQYGATPQGVDWNGADSQDLRFKQLLKVINSTDAFFKINDIGCGYGKFYSYLQSHFNTQFHYQGYDLSQDMIQSAQNQNSRPNNEFIKIEKTENILPADYSIASGIFNVKMELSNDAWKTFILENLKIINQKSIKGFAFNILTKYSDKPFMKDYLYYADPLELFDFCKTNFSKNVALLHDYDLYEFTLLIKK